MIRSNSEKGTGTGPNGHSAGLAMGPGHGAGPEPRRHQIAVQLAAEANQKATHERDFYGAIKLYGDAINENNGDCRFFLNRSYCYAQLELYQLALDDAQEAILLNPALAKCFYRKGQALLGLKKYLDAEKAFQEVLRLEPDCMETKQELFKVRLNALVGLGFDDSAATQGALKYESIRLAADALLSDTLEKNVEFSRNMGSAGHAIGSNGCPRNAWGLGRNTSLGQPTESLTTNGLNDGNVFGVNAGHIGSNSLISGTSLRSLTEEPVRRLKYTDFMSALDPHPGEDGVPSLATTSSQQPSSSTLSFSTVCRPNYGTQNQLVNGASSFSNTSSAAAPGTLTTGGNSANIESLYNGANMDSVFGYSSGNGVDSNNQSVNNTGVKKSDIIGSNLQPNNQPQNGFNLNNHLNLYQTMSQQQPQSGPHRNTTSESNSYTSGLTSSEHITQEGGFNCNINSPSLGYNAFNQLPDSKLIEAIVPNLIGGNAINSSERNGINGITGISIGRGLVGHDSGSPLSHMTTDPGLHLEHNSYNDNDVNSQSLGREVTVNGAHGPTSYSEIVKRAKKPSEGGKPDLLEQVGGVNGVKGDNRNNGFQEPFAHKVTKTVDIREQAPVKLLAEKAKTGSGRNALTDKKPTNLWSYWGLRVANVSNSCSKQTLTALFSKFGRVKLLERINNKAVENNLWVYFDNAVSPAEAAARLQGVALEGVSVSSSQPLRLFFAPTDDQKELKFSRPKQPPDARGECYYWRTTNCFSREQCTLLHIPANKNIDAQIWMKMNKEPKDSLPAVSGKP